MWQARPNCENARYYEKGKENALAEIEESGKLF
jgi:hypothetical protein